MAPAAAILAGAGLAGLSTSACDQGHPHDVVPAIGPPLQVVATNADGTHPLPANAPLTITFNRLLHPATYVRQSFFLRDSAGSQFSPVVVYDPVARSVSLSMPAGTAAVPGLTAGLFYTLILPVPAEGELNAGPRAIDGATLASQYELLFQAGPAVDVPPNDRAISFCDDVLPVFQLRCSGGLCHAAPARGKEPAEGLILETADGVANTALNRVAQEANTGARAGLGLPAARTFGIDMPIIAPNDPGNSWLMYKVLLAKTRAIDVGLDAGVATCTATSAPPTPVFTPLPALMDEDERARLATFMIGNPMPYPLNLADDQQTPVSTSDDESATLPMTVDELERVRAWIAQGAVPEQCSACPVGR